MPKKKVAAPVEDAPEPLQEYQVNHRVSFGTITKVKDKETLVEELYEKGETIELPPSKAVVLLQDGTISTISKE